MLLCHAVWWLDVIVYSWILWLKEEAKNIFCIKITRFI